MNVRLQHRKLCQRAYTLIEVLTAAVIVGVGVSAAVSMSTTMTLQQELSWRVSVALNYQENACRLWQLGLGPNDITAVMPGTKGNPFLGEVLETGAITSTSAVANSSSLGVMETATIATQVANLNNGLDGSNTTFRLYRNVTRSSTYEP
jgi:prepilin-type N-terminal cleavage/methylation domain-containing protein